MSDFSFLSAFPFKILFIQPRSYTLTHLFADNDIRQNSQQLFQLIHMAKSPAWGFSAETSVGLPGAHGSELVRSFCVFDQEQAVFTAGEDGQIIAWRPN